MRYFLLVGFILTWFIGQGQEIVDPIPSLLLKTKSQVAEHLLSKGFSIERLDNKQGSDTSSVVAKQGNYLFEIWFINNQPIRATWDTHKLLDYNAIAQYFSAHDTTGSGFVVLNINGKSVTCAATLDYQSKPLIHLIPGNKTSNPAGFKHLEGLDNNWELVRDYSFPTLDFIAGYHKVVGPYPSPYISKAQLDSARLIQREYPDYTPVFIFVEKMPFFPSCNWSWSVEDQKECTQESLITWIQKNLEYPNQSKEAGIQGIVYIRFVINAKGKITSIELLRGIEPSLDEAALAVVSSLPTMFPGMQNGRPVQVQYTIPVRFRIN
ncbi:MAG: energy transducer TonB [Flavobacteriales bacterium]|nr:energy transducer TonB [Flavobacteriales bacterium]